jgi:plasmid maintenance system killer protein
MIASFRDRRTAAVARGRLPKGCPADILTAARRKLGYLDAATRLEDLRSELCMNLRTAHDLAVVREEQTA